MEVEGEELSKTLPEDLVEKILAMVSFPDVFKVRLLSKAWLAKLSPISSHDEEEKRRLAVAFQKKVSESASKWPTMCPVFLAGRENLIAYDKSSESWRRIPTLSLLPQKMLSMHKEPSLQIKSALMLVETLPFHLSVANVLTRTWKHLPLAQHHFDWYFTIELVHCMESYKVIKMIGSGYYFEGDIYNAQTDSWSRKRIEAPEDFELRRYYGECLDGVLYWFGLGREVTDTYLLTFNVKEETFEVFDMASDIPFRCVVLDLLVCNDSLLMVAWGAGYGNLHNVVVVRMDLESRRWVLVTRGPPDELNTPRPSDELNVGCFNDQPASDGGCIYFSGEFLNNGLAYNVRTDEWSSYTVPNSVRDESNWAHHERHAIQLGLNPFVAV